jgi:hypothetical protein
MEKLFLLSSGLTLGIFNEESSPLVVVILSSVGDFVHISSGDDRTPPEIHLTKCCPSKSSKHVMKLLQFKNTYDLNSSYACSRFHGESIHDHPLRSSPLFPCPFEHRLTCVVPVVYPEETSTGLTSITMEYSVYFRKIFSSKQHRQFVSHMSNFHYPTESRLSSLRVNGSIEIFALYDDLVEEFSLMHNPDYFPSSQIIIIESLDGVIYVRCSNAEEGDTSNHDFQIWFRPPVGGSWQDGEIVTLTRDLVRHQFLQREPLDDHTVTSGESGSSLESGDLARVDHRYCLSVLQLDFDEVNSSAVPSILRRKSEITHLLSFRDHSIRLQSSSHYHLRIENQSRSSKLQASPSSLPPTIIQSERSEYDHSGLYLLSDGTVRGFFPPDRLLLLYLPDLRSVRATLPDGREELYSVDQLLQGRDQIRLFDPNSLLPQGTLLSLLTRRLTQLLSFRRKVTNSRYAQENRNLAIEVTISQYRTRRFLSQAESLLSSNSSIGKGDEI